MSNRSARPALPVPAGLKSEDRVPLLQHSYRQSAEERRQMARAHARSMDTLLLSKYIGKSDAFPESMARFAIAYANQNERDHAELVKAARDGRVEVQFS